MSALRRRAAFGLLPALGAASAVSAAPMSGAANHCPAAAIGRDITALADATNTADEKWLSAAPADTAEAHQHFLALQDRVFERMEALTRVRATSVTGAMAQAMLACSIVGDNGLPPKAEARVGRLLLSVVNALEAAGGTRREAVGGDYLMMRDLDGGRGVERPASIGPDEEIVALASQASALLAVAAEKYDAEPEFKSAEEENAFYSEIDRAYLLVDRLCGLRALTLTGTAAKSRVAKQILGLGHGEPSDQLARSVCADVERGLFFVRGDVA